MYVNKAVMLPLNVIKVVMSLMYVWPAYLENGVSKLFPNYTTLLTTAPGSSLLVLFIP